MRIFIVVCGMICMTGIVLLAVTKNLGRLAKAFLASLGIVGALASFVGVMALVDLQAVIYGFHYMFFDNDLWLMDPRQDMVIWLFSEGMYGSAILRIGVWLAILLVPFSALSVWKIKKEKNVRNKSDKE